MITTVFPSIAVVNSGESNSRQLLLIVKGTLSGLRLFLANERTLKTMKNAFYITLKALFVLKVFKFFSWLFRHV